jgi:CubicO group peptidase (beta-lactamase class C family)
MNLKFHTALLPFSVLLFALNSCQNTTRTDTDPSAKPKDTLAHIEPSDFKYHKLSAEYVALKQKQIAHFSKKTWNESTNVSFLVAKNGQIIFEKYQGYANKQKSTCIDYKTPIHIASVTKVITATAILELIDAKKIALDQKVNTILKEFPYPDITIQTLLNHRSGLRNYAYFTEDKGVWDRKKVLTNADLLRLLGEKKIELQSLPDRKFAYCNTNYAILALVIEKITGLSFADAIKRMIFDPLGMEDSYVYDYHNDNKKSVPSYKGNNVEIGRDYLDAVYGDKNIYSTPRDLLKFDLARNDPDFLSPALHDKIYKGYSNERKGTKNYGLGLRMINWENGKNFYFHNGWWHGNTSAYVTLKDENVVIIALSNKFNRSVYKVRNLAPLFGDYPFKIEKEELE